MVLLPRLLGRLRRRGVDRLDERIRERGPIVLPGLRQPVRRWRQVRPAAGVPLKRGSTGTAAPQSAITQT